ncbi:hypothetical protein [Hydrobacter penzbergensis]|nr:hypothetical protein [Hydrobacter penzbergensis]
MYETKQAGSAGPNIGFFKILPGIGTDAPGFAKKTIKLQLSNIYP